MAVELARQPIKPVNAVQTWREQGDDGEGDNDDDDIDDFVPKTGRLAPSNASSSCLVVIICSLLIVALQLLQTSIMSYRAGGTFSAGIPPDFKFSSEFMKTLIFGKLIFFMDIAMLCECRKDSFNKIDFPHYVVVPGMREVL